MKYAADCPKVHYIERYADVRAALLNTLLKTHKPLAMAEQGEQALATDSTEQLTRSRGIGMLSSTLAEHMSPSAFQPFVGNVSKMADDLVREGRRRGGMDLIADLAHPLPLMVMQELLGLPHTEIENLRPLFTAIASGLDISSTKEQRQAARFALHSMMRWLAPHIEASNSPLMASIRTVAGDSGTKQLVPYWCSMLLFAGSATIRDFIGNFLARLLEHPDEAEQLRQNPGLIHDAIEELLRVEGPVQAVGRVAREDMVIGGQTLSRGSLVYLCLNAANHDPDVFEHPQRVIFTRKPNPHLAFGLGATRCLGIHLARLEASAVLSAVLPYFADMRLVEAPERDHSSVLRSVLHARTRLAINFG